MAALALATPTDDSQEFALDVEFAADLTLGTAVSPPTASLTYFHRTSLVMPTPTLDDRGRPEQPWDPTDTLRGPWGRLQLVTHGQDVTTLRGVAFQPVTQSDADPFGDETLVVRFSQFSTFEHPGSGDLAWLEKGRNIELKRVRPDGTTALLWTGQVQSIKGHGDDSGYNLTVTCRGALFGPDYGVRAPSFDYRERDPGYVIAEAFNLYGGASHGKCIPVVTGITTRKRGNWEKLVSGYVLDILSELTTDDGTSQWTVKQNRRTPVIALRDTTTIHATLTNGVDGLTVDLDSDLASGYNVIYGEGIAPNGMRWGNTKHPRLRPGALPTFPGTTFTPGSGTTGFQPLSDELRLNGYPHLQSQNTYLAVDEDEVKDAQRRAGIVPADGDVDASTWTGIFALGSNRGDLLGSYRAPLASDPRVERYRYNAQGAKNGNNPAFDPTIPRIERFINFGEGVTLAEGKRLSRAILARDQEVGHYGMLTLDGIDPEEMSRLDLRSGMNIKLKGYMGIDRTLHVARREIGWAQEKTPVTVMVDTKGRDRLTLDAIRARNAAAATDPALRQTPQKKSSRQSYDNRIMWDDDAGAGRTYPFACTGGQWTVAPPVPASQRGTIERTHAVMSENTRFGMMVFGKRVTPAMIAARLVNPLAVTDWTDFSDGLVSLGILNGWGTQDAACGYGNHNQAQEGATPNGVFDDGGPWSFESFQPPWLWIAVFPISTCTADVHLYAAAET